MLKNIRFLKWAGYFNVVPHWNLLTGFPGETEDDYTEQRKLIPLLRHLSPPDSYDRLWLLRFSPYFYDPSFPVQHIRPKGIYRFIYPPSLLDLNEVAYFFEYKMGLPIPEQGHHDLFAQLEEWKACWTKHPRPTLMYRRGPGWIEVYDRRGDEPISHKLEGIEASIYDFCCETDHSLEAVHRAMRTEHPFSSLAETEETLHKLCGMGLMVGENGHYLSLALPLNRNWFLKPPTSDREQVSERGIPLPLVTPPVSVTTSVWAGGDPSN